MLAKDEWSMIDWQPIETAPKDESWVLLFFDGRDPIPGPAYRVGFWSVEYCDWYDWEGAGNSLTAFGDYPTHWAALQPPSTYTPSGT